MKSDNEKLKLRALNDIKKYFKMLRDDLDEIEKDLDSKDEEKFRQALVAAMAIGGALTEVPNFIDEVINEVMQKEKEKQEE